MQNKDGEGQEAPETLPPTYLREQDGPWGDGQQKQSPKRAGPNDPALPDWIIRKLYELHKTRIDSYANSTSIISCRRCSLLKTRRSSWPSILFLLFGGSPNSPVHLGALFAIESTKIALLQLVQTNTSLCRFFPFPCFTVGVPGGKTNPDFSRHKYVI